MILTLIGLILSFCGSTLLVIDTILNLGKERTSFIPSRYNSDGKPIKFIRQQKVYGINDGWGGYKEVKVSKEEIKSIIALSLLGVGFLLQILDFVPKEFWEIIFSFLFQ
jgi:hypothetical protein